MGINVKESISDQQHLLMDQIFSGLGRIDWATPALNGEVNSLPAVCEFFNSMAGLPTFEELRR